LAYIWKFEALKKKDYVCIKNFHKEKA